MSIIISLRPSLMGAEIWKIGPFSSMHFQEPTLMGLKIRKPFSSRLKNWKIVTFFSGFFQAGKSQISGRAITYHHIKAGVGRRFWAIILIRSRAINTIKQFYIFPMARKQKFEYLPVFIFQPHKSRSWKIVRWFDLKKLPGIQADFQGSHKSWPKNISCNLKLPLKNLK